MANEEYINVKKSDLEKISGFMLKLSHYIDEGTFDHWHFGAIHHLADSIMTEYKIRPNSTYMYNKVIEEWQESERLFRKKCVDDMLTKFEITLDKAINIVKNSENLRYYCMIDDVYVSAVKDTPKHYIDVYFVKTILELFCDEYEDES
jgi:hypothetical protein